MHICPCSRALGICKNIGIPTYFGSMTVESVGVFRHFAFCNLGNRLASFFVVPKNCIFWDASFEPIKNLATLFPKKLQGFHWTLLYHCYTLLLMIAHPVGKTSVQCILGPGLTSSNNQVSRRTSKELLGTRKRQTNSSKKCRTNQSVCHGGTWKNVIFELPNTLEYWYDRDSSTDRTWKIPSRGEGSCWIITIESQKNPVPLNTSLEACQIR